MKELLEYYKNKRVDIKKRLEEFKDSYTKDDRDIFSELCFCILTPQSNAVRCDEAIRELRKTEMLYNGTAGEIRPKLKSARFFNQKAEYLVEARNLFKKNGCFCIKEQIDEKDIVKTRDWLVKNVKGFGYKEASHFLRNIGFGKDIAILDKHILKNLKKYSVIKEIPKSLTKKRYLEIETKMREFSKRIDIPMDELDLLFWSKETGFIFK